MTRSSAEPLPARLRRVTAALGSAGLVLAAGAALHVRDPHDQGSWGFCPFLALTGAFCPGCGGLRAVNDLTHLDVAAAASSNLLLVASLPLVLVAWVGWLWAGWTGRRRPLPAPALASLGVALLLAGAAFSVLRNLPAGAWLAP